MKEPGFGRVFLLEWLDKEMMMAQKTIFELDLVRIAKWHLRCTVFAFALAVSFLGLVFVGLNQVVVSPILELIAGWFFIGLLLLNVFFVVILKRACGTGVGGLIVYGILAFFLHVLVLISTVSNAGVILRLAGAKSGFLGVGKDQWDKLRPGHCRGCGYSREGLELLQECPECERVPQVI